MTALEKFKTNVDFLENKGWMITFEKQHDEEEVNWFIRITNDISTFHSCLYPDIKKQYWEEVFINIESYSGREFDFDVFKAITDILFNYRKIIKEFMETLSKDKNGTN